MNASHSSVKGACPASDLPLSYGTFQLTNDFGCHAPFSTPFWRALFFRDLRKLEGGLPLLKGVVDLSTAEVKDVGQFQEQLVQLVAELKALEPGKVKMVPGGWDGATGASTVVHLVEKEGSDTYAFVTCNAGKGLIYHPCTPAEAPKIKYKTCLRIGRIPADRMTSMAFWSVLLSQWMKVRFNSLPAISKLCQHGLPPDPVRAS